VRPLYGHGIREFGGVARDIGKLPDLLTWDVSLQTVAQSALEFGRRGTAAYVLAADSRLQLSTDTDSTRMILLTQGSLRARNLGAGRSGWAIKVGDQSRIETDSDGDILVQVTSESTARLTVLRGRAKLFLAAKPEGVETSIPVEVEQGYSLSFNPKSVSRAMPELANFGEIQSLVVATSAQYLPENLLKWPDKGAFYLGVPAPKTPAAAMDQARTFNHDRDFISAIETLAPHWSHARNTSEGNTVLAEAYVGLFMFDRATMLLGDAIQLDPSAATPYFVMGKIKLNQKHWRQAARAFEAAAKLNYPDQKNLNYQLGVAQYHRNLRNRAKSAFTKVHWNGDDDEISRSARDYLKRLKDDTWYEATTSLGLFYDSSILRVSSLKLVLPNGDLRSNYGSGYQGDIRLSLWPYRGDSATARFTVEADITDYIKPTNSELSLMKQRIGFDTNLGFGGTRDDRILIFGLGAFAGAETLGGQKNLTKTGTNISLWSPKLYDLHAVMERSQAIDAAPGRERFVEPIRWELAGSGDYSAVLPYYDVSAGFQAISNLSFKLGVRVGEGNYRNVSMHNQNFHDSGFRLDSVYEPGPRGNMNLGFVYNSRKFPNSSDQRSDSSIKLRINWRWWVTDSVAQLIEGSYEAQTSSRALNNFKRKYLTYKLTMDI
jgi:tetratricopeptide (TPR) repeat protein